MAREWRLITPWERIEPGDFFAPRGIVLSVVKSQGHEVGPGVVDSYPRSPTHQYFTQRPKPLEGWRQLGGEERIAKCDKQTLLSGVYGEGPATLFYGWVGRLVLEYRLQSFHGDRTNCFLWRPLGTTFLNDPSQDLV